MREWVNKGQILFRKMCSSFVRGTTAGDRNLQNAREKVKLRPIFSSDIGRTEGSRFLLGIGIYAYSMALRAGQVCGGGEAFSPKCRLPRMEVLTSADNANRQPRSLPADLLAAYIPLLEYTPSSGTVHKILSLYIYKIGTVRYL